MRRQFDRRAIGAAYTKALPARQCDRPGRRGRPLTPLCRIVFPDTAFRAIELSRECVRPMTQELKQALKPDICVIGAGAAGRAAASAAAAFGVPVVLIEKGTLGGGAGNGGSVPATALAVTAERANIIRNAAHFGLKAARFGVDFAAVKAHLRDVADTVAPIEARAASGRSRRADHRRRRAVFGCAHRRRRRLHHRGAPLRHRHRLVAGAAGDPRPCRHAASHQRHRVRSRRLPAPSHRHRRRLGRSRTGADFPAARRRRHRARSGDAAGERRSRMRRHRARRARTRRHHAAHRCRHRAGAARAGEDRDRYRNA